MDGVGLTFDALMRMVEQNRSGAYTQIVYAPTGEKLALMNGQALVKAFVPLPGSSTAVYTSTGLSYYRHSDWLGSSRLNSTPGRTVSFTTAYAPFGESYAQSGTPDLSFTGQNQDTSSGVYDFKFREYTTQGRWPSPDPAGISTANQDNPQSWNLYAYVVNNPLALVDPSGLDGDCPPGVICGIFVWPPDLFDPFFFFRFFLSPLGPGIVSLYGNNWIVFYVIPAVSAPPPPPPPDPLPAFALGVFSKVRQLLYPLAEPQTLRVCSGGVFGFAGPKFQAFGVKGEVLAVHNYDFQSGHSTGLIGEADATENIALGGEFAYSWRQKKFHVDALGFGSLETRKPVRVKPGLFGAKTKGLSLGLAGAGGLVTPTGEIGLYGQLGPVGAGGYARVCATPDPN